MFTLIWTFLGGTWGKLILLGIIVAAVIGGYFYWRHAIGQAAIAKLEQQQLQNELVQEQNAAALEKNLNAQTAANLARSQAAVHALQAKLARIRSTINRSQFSDGKASAVELFTVQRIITQELAVPVPTVSTPVVATPTSTGLPPAPIQSPPAPVLKPAPTATPTPAPASTGNTFIDQWKQKLSQLEQHL